VAAICIRIHEVTAGREYVCSVKKTDFFVKFPNVAGYQSRSKRWKRMGKSGPVDRRAFFKVLKVLAITRKNMFLGKKRHEDRNDGDHGRYQQGQQGKA
jgi:hypothetical protein